MELDRLRFDKILFSLSSFGKELPCSVPFVDSGERTFVFRIITIHAFDGWTRVVAGWQHNKKDPTVSAVVNVSLPESSEKDAKLPPTEANMIVDIVIPSLLIAALFIGNAFIVLIIYKYRKRKTDDIEDEFNTIPLSVNGNIHSAGNAV